MTCPRLPLPRWARVLLVCLLVLALALAGLSLYLKQRFEGNIDTQPFLSPTVTGVERPVSLPEAQGALNVLVMGSDTREGANGKGIGGDTPGLSDTTMLLHLSASKKFAYGVSIPRDSMVERPACPRKDGNGVDPGGFTQFNAAYAVGGPACTVATVEQATGVHIDHFMVIDFSGFRSMVDALGGVTMCVPQEINDSEGRIHLPAGTYKMDGQTALAYVRVRHGLAVDTGDIGRMKRQQAFLSAMIAQATSAGTLARPTRLLELTEQATKSLTTDPDLANLRKLAGLAASLREVGVDHIKFITTPFELWPQDPNRVVWTPEAESVWQSFTHDRPLPAGLRGGAVSPDGKKPGSAGGGLDSDTRKTYGLC